MFGDEVKAAREGAAQRLGRELERAVQAFVREAESVLGERVRQVGETGAQRLEKRLAGRLEDAEAESRRRLQTLAADAEAERGILEARLHELGRRVEDTMAHAQERLASLEQLR